LINPILTGVPVALDAAEDAADEALETADDAAEDALETADDAADETLDVEELPHAATAAAAATAANGTATLCLKLPTVLTPSYFGCDGPYWCAGVKSTGGVKPAVLNAVWLERMP
jgi:hypothetical protein